MDFRQTIQPGSRPAAPSAPEQKDGKIDRFTTKRGRPDGVGKFMRIIYAILLVGIAVLLLCIAFGIARNTNPNESKYIDSGKYQAVFLNNGQVYFGNIDTLNNSYVRMSNIYYLTQDSSSNSSNYSLVKLGCQQIHDPLDEMIINRSQVTFWENLSNDGKVVKSIQQFKQQNPNGPDCSQVSNQTQAPANAGAQGSDNTSTNPTNTNSKQ